MNSSSSSCSSAIAGRDRDRRKRNFVDEWEEIYFVVNDNGNPRCLICSHWHPNVKKYNVERHFKKNHAEEIDALSAEDRLRRLESLKCDFVRDEADNHSGPVDAVKASYHIALKLAQRGKAFVDGELIKECLVTAAHILCPTESSRFEHVSLSRHTMSRRIVDMASDVKEQLKQKAKSFISFAIALDESTDVSDTAQLALYVRGVDAQLQVTEELLDLVPMKDTTTAEDIFKCVAECFSDMDLRWEVLSSVATDGAASMVGVRSGVVVRMREKVKSIDSTSEVTAVHCILHRENLCAKSIKLGTVMDVVVKTVNFIRAHGLNHRQFQEFLQEMEAEFTDLPYYCEVRWLSRGDVLKRFFTLREEINLFMDMKGKPVLELSSPQWVADLAFLADLTAHLNTLNTSLQGKGHLITQLWDIVRSFLTKLTFWRDQLVTRNACHFPNLLSITSEDICFDEYIKVLNDLFEQFTARFQDLNSLEPLFKIFATPFSVDISSAPTKFQMELIDLKCDTMLTDKYSRMDNDVTKFYASFPRGRFPQLHKLAAQMLSMFGTTYLCEKFFSVMKITKPRLRGQLLDQHLRSSLRLMCTQNFAPNIDKLVDQKRCQVSSSSSRSSTLS